MRKEHPARRAAHLASRKISVQIRHEFPDVEYEAGVGYCGPQWQQATARYKELRSAPDFVALQAAAAAAPLFADPEGA